MMSIYFEFNSKFCFFCILIYLSSIGTSVLASHCELVEHYELVRIEDKPFSARINKCVLKSVPSYIVKSDIVKSPDEPQFRKEGQTCCCLADGHIHTVPITDKVKLRFKIVTRCTCGECFR